MGGGGTFCGCCLGGAEALAKTKEDDSVVVAVAAWAWSASGAIALPELKKSTSAAAVARPSDPAVI